MRWFEVKWLGRSALWSAAALAALCGSAMSQSPDGPPPPREPRPPERREDGPPRPGDRRDDPPPRPRDEGKPVPRAEGRPDGPRDEFPGEDRRREDGRRGEGRDEPYADPRYAPRRPGDGPQYGFDDGGRPRPIEVRGRFRPMGPPPEEMDRMRRDDPEMFQLIEQDQQLERECGNMAEQIRKQPNKEASSEARKKLAELVKTHFEIRQKQRELRLQRLEAELKRVKEAVEARQAQAEQIIKRRLNELTGEADDISF